MSSSAGGQTLSSLLPNVPLKKIKQVHFGLFSPDEIVSVTSIAYFTDSDVPLFMVSYACIFVCL